jgi:endonuclease/exonuclease/phosphatase family metal-dependent hydrolase
LINFHAIPHDQQPEQEIKIVRDLAFNFGDTPVIFMADWNVVDHHTVFNPLKRIGYHFALTGKPTTLKFKCVDQHYKNHAIDNILLPPAFSIKHAGIHDFVGHCDNLTSARKISDHLPVWVEVARK